ncbi:MAG: hypothetical protein JXA91_00940 [Candidatus Thermoplasmatota archaeon]|nr:hypothetical protein [Candidatus Thermoplasmatota archaeon]
MRKCLYLFGIIIPLMTCIVYAATENKNLSYYKLLANLPLCEIIKKEEMNIKAQFLKNNTNEILKNKLYEIMKKTKDCQNVISSNDVLTLLSIADIINDKNNSINIGKEKWLNPLSYSLCIAAIDTSITSMYDFAIQILYIHGTDEFIKVFSDEIKKRLLRKNVTYYYNLLIKCVLDEHELDTLLERVVARKKYDILKDSKLILKNKKNKVLKLLEDTKVYEYRALYGDTIAENILLQIADTIRNFEGKVDIAKKLGIANTSSSVLKLVELLNDTSKQTPVAGVEYYLRTEIFQILFSVLDTIDLFNEKYRNATRQDMKETSNGEYNVKQYFNEVADWAKENYNIELPNLRKANCFIRGHSVPIISW